MRNLIKDIIYPQSNIEEIVMQILHDFQVIVNRGTISQQLKEHPFFPSFSSVQDVVSNYGIASECRKIGVEDITQKNYPLYSLIQVIVDERNLFALLYKKGESTIEWLNPLTHQREEISLERLRQIYTGYIMMFNDSKKKDEENYIHSCLSEWARNIIKICALLFLPFLSIISLYNYRGSLHIILTILYLLGNIMSLMIFYFELKGIPKNIKRICNYNEHISCEQTFSSKESQITSIPWSIIGAFYFGGMLSAICLTGFSTRILVLAAIIHVLALCFSIYSIYFQAFSVRKWCPFCLTIQLICIIIFFCFWKTGYYHSAEMCCIISSETLILSFCLATFFYLFSLVSR